MLRRRLNTLGRAAAAEILRMNEHHANLPIVYGSRHGDIERTLNVLSEMARGEPVSPMHFSLSVHNAITGILSIHSGTTAGISSIAALEECLVPVLLEAVGLLHEGHERVICVIADVPVPLIYRRDCPWPATPFAAGFTVSADGGLQAMLTQDSSPIMPQGSEDIPEALQFIEFLASGARLFHSAHNGGHWIIAKR